MDEHDIEVLEELVMNTSVPYRDSKAFRLAMRFVKRRDKEMYLKLLMTEADECGFEY